MLRVRSQTDTRDAMTSALHDSDVRPASSPETSPSPATPVDEHPQARIGLPPATGRLLEVSRAGVVVLLVLAVANGAFLYFLPAHAQSDYAWRVVPPVNAGFLGAGYLAGTLATALVVFATRSWRSLRVLPLPLVVLSVTLLAATLLHTDRFRWDYPPTWLWTAVYAVVPFGVAALWRRQERAAPPPPARHAGLRGLRLGSAAIGGPLLAGALALFLAPAALADFWPWPLTPLLARAVASWYALIGTALLVCAWSLRRPSEAIIPYATLLTWSALLLLLPVLHTDDFVAMGPEVVGWLAVQTALNAIAIYALMICVPLARANAERL
jgi:hypothetical protein